MSKGSGPTRIPKRYKRGNVKSHIGTNVLALLNMVQKEGWSEKNQNRYREVFDKVYDEEQKQYSMMPTKLKNEDEKNAVAEYQRWGFESINEKLRSNRPLDKKEEAVKQQLDKIIQRTTLSKDVTVFRGTQNKPTATNKGYTSTSRMATVAEHFSSGMYGSKHMYAYRIPKGTHCLVIGGAEDEIIFPRNFNIAKYKIKI